MSKKGTRVLIILLIGGILITACGTATEAPVEAPTEEQITESPTEQTIEEEVDQPTQEIEEAIVEPTEEPTEEAGCASEAMLCIGFVTDMGGLDDKSFNDAIWEALKLAESEYDATINYIETIEGDATMANIEAFAAEDYDIIVTLGDAAGQATLESANKYPELQFIGVGQFIEGAPDNYTRLVFNQSNFGFMAGVLAGLLTKSNIIAGVFGTEQMPLIVTFQENYEKGAKWTNPDVQVIATYHPGGFDVAFTDPDWGAARAAEAIAQGADVVFTAAGMTGNGVLIETAQYEGVFCIGVDNDMWELLPEAHNCLVSSEYRLLAPGVYELIQMAVSGKLSGGEVIGEIGLASFHDFEGQISQEVKDKLAQARQGLKDGTIDLAYP
ncbi:MAG: BMP family protein [Anaerolineales bacterium]